MKAFILTGFFGLFIIAFFGFSSNAADTLPSDAVIQQQIVGAWLMRWMILNSTTTIATNGDYVRYDVSNSVPPQTNRYEGTIKIKDGLMLFTTNRISLTNQPAPHAFTNVIIQLSDNELIFRAQNGRQPMIWERIKP